MKNKPVPLAMIICDTIIDDRDTNKKSLIGVFNNISSSQFPCRHYKMNIFVSLTDGRGKVAGKLKCVKKDTNKNILELGGPIEFPNGNAVVEFNFEIMGIVFPEPGIYTFDFFCDNEPIISRNFIVTKK